MSIDFNELIKSSYISVIKAIVPPETPGITLALPLPFLLKIKKNDSSFNLIF